MKQRAVIIGAGPAGLTAAHELLERTSVTPLVVEAAAQVGGLAKTVEYKGNRLDMGGHRFFSKSPRVNAWWGQFLPPAEDAPAGAEDVMTTQRRRSRILFAGQLYAYPLHPSPTLLRQLGLGRSTRIAASYAFRTLFPRRPERNLEDFMINRFGDALYHAFFQHYTEKVWGVPCQEISSDWGAQRIKDVSLGGAVLHWWRTTTGAGGPVPTSLIGRFLYPRYGPGQLWEAVARRVTEAGGAIQLQRRVTRVHLEGHRVVAVTVRNEATGAEEELSCDHALSSMPIPELARSLEPGPPAHVLEAADGLEFRDFIVVGVLARRLKPRPEGPLDDCWLYIQEPSVHMGRLQLYNNWSTGMVADRSLQWLGIEYFCNVGDALWNRTDEAMKALAAEELGRLGIVDADDVVDAVVVRVEKAYPAYFSGYARFPEIRAWFDGIENLFLIGRNGMHRYNNQDHAMLTGMAAVDAVGAGSADKSALWAVNAKAEYHEET